jgi:hypothetical protein
MNHPLITTSFRSDLPEGLQSRTYNNGYPSFDHEMDANLYYWIRQSFRVLWSFDDHGICIYENLTRKLAQRLTPQLKRQMSETDVYEAVATMVKTLAKADFIACEGLPGQPVNPAAILEQSKNWLSPESDTAMAFDVFARKFGRGQLPL